MKRQNPRRERRREADGRHRAIGGGVPRTTRKAHDEDTALDIARTAPHTSGVHVAAEQAKRVTTFHRRWRHDAHRPSWAIRDQHEIEGVRQLGAVASTLLQQARAAAVITTHAREMSGWRAEPTRESELGTTLTTSLRGAPLPKPIQTAPAVVANHVVPRTHAEI